MNNALKPMSSHPANPLTKAAGSTFSPLIHLIDDDEAVRDALSLLISTVGLRVQPWADPQAFMQGFDRQAIGAIVLDVRMPGISGLTVLETLVSQGVDQPVIMLTGHGWRRCKTPCASTSSHANATKPTGRRKNGLRNCQNENAKCWA